jgi:hypothetical protein
MSYQILRTLSEVESMERDWSGLLSDDAAPFVTFGWNFEWLRSFQSLCDEILVFVFYDEGKPLAIFPLYRKEGQVRFVGDGCSHHQDIIGRDAASAKWTWRVVMGYVRSEGCSMIMPKVAAESLIAQVFALSEQDTPLLLRQEQVGFSPCLSVRPIGDEENVSPVPSPRGVEIRFQDGPGIMDGLVRKVSDLHCEQQRIREEVSLFENDVFQRFVRAVVRREDAGSRLATLEMGGQVIAFVLGFERGGTFYVYASGLDERYRNQAPDRYLWGELMRRAREEGAFALIDISCSPEAAGATRPDAEYELLAFTLRQKSAMNRLLARTVGFLPPTRRADGLARRNSGLHERAGRG